MLDFFVDYRDFGYGSGFISPDNKKFYINIPKNASSFMRDYLSKSNWTSTTIGREGTQWDEVEELIIVLRDPVERWISGISQFIKGNILESQNPEDFINSYNIFLERLIFSTLNIFDDHVWPQVCYFDNLLTHAKRKYIFINENFATNIRKELSLPYVKTSELEFNRGADDQDLVVLNIFFETKIKKNKKLYQKVKNAYKIDYDLINNNYIVY